MADWAVVLRDRVGGFLAPVTVPFKVRRGLNEAAHVSFTVDHEDEVAYKLLDELPFGIPQIAAYRDGVLWARGWWHPMEETAGQDTTMACVFRGPFAELETTGIDADYKSGLAANGDYLPMTADQAAHAVALVTWTKTFSQGRLDDHTGLRAGQQTASVVRERTYARGKNIGEAIIQLTEVQGGIEFIERPVAALTATGGVVVLAEFDVGGPAQFGTDKSASVIFEHGFGAHNALSVNRQISRPINRVHAFGAETSIALGSPTQIYRTRHRRVVQDEASIAKYQPRELVLDVPDASFANLLEHANGALRPDPVQAVTFQPDASGDLQPWTSYWIGDTIRLVADRAALQVDMTARVRAIEVAVDADGNEAHTLEIGDQRARPLVDLLRGAGRVVRGAARSGLRSA